MAPTRAEALATAAARLAAGSPSPRLDAELLLVHVLGRARTHLYAWPEQHLTRDEANAFEAMLKRRLDGEPMAYLLGEREFWSLTLAVGPGTLIPRPETEHLVEAALARLPAGTPCRVADLGTGSGAIALAVAHERPRARVIATDTSATALRIARANARRLGLRNVVFRRGAWFIAVPRRPFDVIASNPPYVDADDPHLEQGDVRFEPRSALIAADKGRADLTHLIENAPRYLTPHGWLLLEHGPTQSRAVTAHFHRYGYRDVATLRDLAGHPRISAGRRPDLTVDASNHVS